MSEIVEYVHHGASKVTPAILERIHKKLPILKMEFAQINAPDYPHLVDQLDFLADVVEDFSEGVEKDLPLVCVASAGFALMYAHEQLDLIPDSVPKLGHADDSSVVRVVLIEYERALANYAKRQKLDWNAVTVKA